LDGSSFCCSCIGFHCIDVHIAGLAEHLFHSALVLLSTLVGGATRKAGDSLTVASHLDPRKIPLHFHTKLDG
jgi:hypothetical protein